jgi:hypothetical protein
MNIFIKSSLLFVIAASLTFVTGCDRKVDFQISPAVPAATAKGKVSKNRNNNTVVEFSVRNLAPPERLTPPRKFYVVWIQPPGQFPENRGQLVIDGSKLSGKKTIATPHREFDIFITAEDALTGTIPTGEQIMRASPRR